MSDLDYEIVVEEDRKSVVAAEAPAAEQDDVPFGMRWITHVAAPIDPAKSKEHGKWMVAIHPPVPTQMPMVLTAMSGAALYNMVASGLPPCLLTQDTLMPTMLGRPLDLVTTYGDLVSQYLAVFAYHSASASAPTNAEAAEYAQTGTFQEESTESLTSLTSWLVYGYLQGREFSGAEHLQFQTPASISPTQMDAIIDAALSGPSRPDGVLPGVMVAKFLVNRLMAYIRSGGTALKEWFTEAFLKKMPKREFEVDAADVLKHHVVQTTDSVPFVQGAVLVRGRFRTTPAWFRAFCVRRNWFFPPVLPTWFTEMWLVRVSTRIVLYEQNIAVQKFVQTRTGAGAKVLDIFLNNTSEKLSDDGLDAVAAEVRASFKAGTEYLELQRSSLREILSPVRCAGDIIDGVASTVIPNEIVSDGATVECVVGEAAFELVDGKKVYVDDGNVHIDERTYKRFVAETEFANGATTTMIDRLAASLGIAKARIAEIVACIDATIPDDADATHRYSAPVRQIVRGLVCLGLQDKHQKTMVEAYEAAVGAKTAGAEDTARRMQLAEADVVQTVMAQGRLVMTIYYVNLFPSLAGMLRNLVAAATAGPDEPAPAAEGASD